MPFNERQCHSTWYQNVEFSGIYNPTKFERNQLKVSECMLLLNSPPPPPFPKKSTGQDNECELHHTYQVWMIYHIQFNFTKNFVQELAQKILVSCTPMTLNEGLDHTDEYQISEFVSTYHQTKFEPNCFINLGIHAHLHKCLNVRWHKQFVYAVRQQLFPLIQYISLQSSIRIVNLSCSNTTWNCIVISWKVCKKMMTFSLWA